MIPAILARLADQVPALRLVEGAAEFAALVDGERLPRAMPAAYGFLAGETGSDSPTWSRTRQRVPVQIGLVLVARNVADARGEAAAADIDTLRAAVRAALLGWVPAAGCAPMQFASGALAAFRAGALWWLDTWRTEYTITNA